MGNVNQSCNDHCGNVRVYVGFAWQKNCDCRGDARWSAIKKYFKKTNEFIEKKSGVRVEFLRLRASHGRFIWDSVREKIQKADVLLFDVAALSEDGAHASQASFNINVVLELGAAVMNPKSKILVMCPTELKDRWPSDLSGLLYTEYREAESGDVLQREYVDKWGVLPRYRGMLAEVVEEKGLGITPDANPDDEDEIPQEDVENMLKDNPRKDEVAR